jgi:hypothetical protein
MANENEPKKVTRRQFLKGALALGASALIGPGCQPDQAFPGPEEKPTDQPTITPTKEISPSPQSTATKEPTAIPTPEATSTPETKLVAGIDITEDYLKNAFAGIGGEEVIQGEGEYQRLDVISFGERYVSSSWGEEINFTKLSEDPIASIKYLISLGAYQGRLGLYSPGKEGEQTIFPGLVEDKEGQENPLNLLRLELANLPSKDEEKDDYSERVSPPGLKLEKGTQITILGYLEQDQEDKLVIDQGEEETKLHYVVAAFTDYHRASQDGVPRHYLALIPSHFPADPDNKQALSLANLLTLNGYDYDPAQKAIAFTDPKTKEDTTWQLNKFVGQDFHQDLFRAAGLAFVDQINNDQIRNPILPYPQGVQDKYQLKREDNQFLFTGQDQTGQEASLKATYDQEKEAWEWERIFSSEELLAKAPAVEGLGVCWEEGRVVYRAEVGNPYSLESGEYAGYLFEFNDETGVSSGKGLVLAGEVRRKLLEQANTPEAIERGEWRMTFPFDPRGERIRIREVGDHNNIAINGLSSNIKVRSPFIESTEAKYYSNRSLHVNLYVPNNLLIDSKKDTNYKVAYYFPSAETVTVDNAGRTVGFNELLFSGIGDSYVKGLPPYFPSDIQILITAGNRNAAINLSLSRFLMVDQAPVFGLDKD